MDLNPALLTGLYEHSPWIVAQALARGPFRSLAAFKRACVEVLEAAGREAQLQLIRAHPELVGKAGVDSSALTRESRGEQSSAGLASCSPEEFARLQQLNRDYNARFGWPFILAVRGPRGLGLTRTQVIDTFARRLLAHPDTEFLECQRQIHRIAELRLMDALGERIAEGEQCWDWAEQLARHSDDAGQLTVTYCTPAHQACARQLQAWMREVGFDEVRIDAVGNVVGRYHGTGTRCLMTGSHYDTVRKAGRYDGRLGILAPLAAVRRLAGRRLPVGLELVAFAEEEGQRFPATFLASSALTGSFQPAWLEQRDAAGVTMREAMQAAGLPGTMEAIAALRRDPANYLGFVELHIEQGPVLDAAQQPLGVVTSINGSHRYLGEFVGQACHAGTTPMAMRQDALLGLAELALFTETQARALGAVGTVGICEVPSGSINVVPGCCRFSLDLRAPDDATRDALRDAVLQEAQAVAGRRGLRCELQATVAADAAPSHPDWQARWEAAVRQLGLPVHRLNSGAGHDAMKLHQILPQAMLFVRGGNAGISHNPLETITAHDAQLAVDAFAKLWEGLA
ncbi:2-oxo-4-hydroxy-4-carboxy-5-ureidoimidazoline decarboxylase [Inhella sp.]|uniref:2-oxo-4-hydroxy-4-carboxy-5-ureidoimidazoline decarboxylase n=1 Tax=Inhella sp. TaxID=1921806 RepID=UPI0035B46581